MGFRNGRKKRTSGIMNVKNCELFTHKNQMTKTFGIVVDLIFGV
jgi:hypothetical protein